jgi:hypothetical protein
LKARISFVKQNLKLLKKIKSLTIMIGLSGLTFD